ncbi:unnamed protein product [Trypanosoma congolense IL3000]|uniref:WGS project CAEQ00000000 data, annotated contig 2298 n=1 Tax=Trypanosoma congolense (strain IL3000) TaxID=1068625 RepID=F9WCZ5_TRYCI|nr:unnamed protein product [Trypanosoma congolense IL3000]
MNECATDEQQEGEGSNTEKAESESGEDFDASWGPSPTQGPDSDSGGPSATLEGPDSLTEISGEVLESLFGGNEPLRQAKDQAANFFQTLREESTLQWLVPERHNDFPRGFQDESFVETYLHSLRSYRLRRPHELDHPKTQKSSLQEREIVPEHHT